MHMMERDVHAMKDGSKSWPPSIMAPTEPGVCEQMNGHPDTPLQDGRKWLYCPAPPQSTSWCMVSGPWTCDQAYDDSTFIDALCYPYPPTKSPPVNSVRISYDNSDRNQSMCVCPEGTRPELESGSCIKRKPIIVGFFNGVWNTDKQASDGLQALEELIGPTYQGTDLRYENFYNQTGTVNGNTALQDIAEVFIQRSKELDGVLNNRWEHYWELLAGKHAEGDSLTARLLNGIGNGASALAGLFGATFNAMLGQMFSGYSQMLSNPPTEADVAGQLQKLRSLADEGYSFVLIAHSQGNLFVNSAYDGLRSSHPDTKAGVVHVAPASPTLRDEHLLADIDLVINGLRVQGISTVAPININLPARKSDLSGHTLVGTYLDAARAAREKINGMVQAVLGKL